MVGLSLAVAGVAVPLVAGLASASPGGDGVVINEVYGGGGNSGSHFKADFVELFNPTSAAVDLDGWTVQYRSATGVTVQETPLSGSIAADSFYLVQESTAGTSGDQAPLPTPDATGTIGLSATGGVVILADSATGVTAQGDLAGLAGVVDAVGWGGSTTSFEGTGPAPATSNTTSISRTNGIDTDQNSADFTVGPPTPQSSSGTTAGGGSTVTVTSPGPQAATVGTAITPLTLAASGGTPPYTWTATGLPAGLSISTDGVISGTPTAVGSAPVTATATDSAGVPGSITFTFAVSQPGQSGGTGSGVVINEVYGGGGNSGSHYKADFVELFNPTSAAVDLDGWTVQYRSAAGTSVQETPLTGSIAASGHYLVQESDTGTSGDQIPLPAPDVTGSIAMSATGAVVILADSATQVTAQGDLTGLPGVVDAVGWGSATSFEGTGPAPATSNTTSDSRTNGVNTNQNAADFTAGAPTPQSSLTDSGGLGTVTVTNPGNQSATIGTAITPITLTATGGTPPYTWKATGLAPGLTISPDGVISGTATGLVGGSVTVTATDSNGISGSAAFDLTPQPPADLPITPIATVRGTYTATSPFDSQVVAVEGDVTAVYATGGFDGFFLETGGAGGTEAQDTTPGASDAIFVFGSISSRQVQVGESVEVAGEVEEFEGQTEIDFPTVTPLTTALPAVIPDQIPWSDLATDAEKQAHDGELMAPQGDFTVSENFNANFFGSFTLASGDTPLQQPTDVGAPGSSTAEAVAADDAARMVTLDDGQSTEFDPGTAAANTPLPWLTPTNTASVDSRVTFHQPVILAFEFSAWSFEPTLPVTGDGSDVATFSDTRSQNEQPANVGGQIRLATFNVENYFPMTGEEFVSDGLGTCTYYDDRQGNHIAVNTCTTTSGGPGPRGAADEASFERQQEKIVTGINRLGASIVSLEEIENSAQFGEPRDTALAGLVDALNQAAGSDVWAYVPSPPADQLPPLSEQDVIRTALIYKPADVTPVGPSTVLTGDSGPGQPFSIAREPLAQGFKAAGAPDSAAFLVVANHLKSKSADSSPLNPGDTEDTSSPAVDQGAFNATRVLEAADLNTFATQAAASLGTNRVFLIGDFNSYTQEDPMRELYADGYTDMGSTLDPGEATYTFDSLAGSLDHVLANPAALAMVTGADVWKINAQESVAYAYSRYNYNVTQLFNGSDPFAASDHDPVVVGLNLPGTWSATTTYQAGATVAFQGTSWQALWTTTNQQPGDPNGPWEQIETNPDGTAVWTPSRQFSAGATATYKGSTWQALWQTRNQTPGDPNGPWEQIETNPDGTAVWTPTRVFNAGDTATYNGTLWRAQWYTRDQAPGQPNGPWVPAT